MSKVEAILSQLKDIAANPKKAMDDYKAESKQEVKVKRLANAYLYLLNNIQQSFTKELLEHTYFLLTNKRLNKNKIQIVIYMYE